MIEPTDSREAGAIIAVLALYFIGEWLILTIRDILGKRGDRTALCRRMHVLVGIMFLALSGAFYNLTYVIFWKLGYGDPPARYWAFEAGHWARFLGFMLIVRVAMAGRYKTRTWAFAMGCALLGAYLI